MCVRGVADKLGYRPGMTVAVFERPGGLAALSDLPGSAAPDGPADLVLAFVDGASAVAPALSKALSLYRRGGRLWFAYPKKSGKFAANISRDHGWEPMADRDLLPVTQISIDGDWSALRFRYRDEIPKLTRKP